jgi:hypothetical protein
MKKIKHILILIIVFSFYTNAQIGRGDPNEKHYAIHNGNRVITVFSNWGVIAQPGDYGPAGAWKNPNNKYVGDVSPLAGVSLPVKDFNNDGITDTLFSVISTEVTGHGEGDYSPGGGRPWTFEPIPGFSSNNTIAMSNNPDSWPPFWPDQPTWFDENGNVEWNGYFGRGQMNADQESYFMMDDNYDEKFFINYGFLPDSTDPTRKGQALRVSVRGLQWADFLAQDVVFWLYEMENVGTTIYKQAVFGALVGTYIGLPGNEYLDDCSFFNIRDNITYTWDYDSYVNPSANPNWQGSRSDVGYVAYSFLESPGNKYDGIDNDNDCPDNLQSFEAADFNPRTIKAGDKLILINENTYERSEYIMPAYPVTVNSLGRSFNLIPDTTVLVEGNLTSGSILNSNAYDGIDNDLDGLIDENYQLHYRQYKKDSQSGFVLIDTLNPVKHTNYFTSLTKIGNMIDEGRDDNIDNDSDWSRNPETGEIYYNESGNLLDDVGADGKENTSDPGENDRLPTPGEPNFDKTDVDESDQIGLTSFHYFSPAGDIDLSDENDTWRRMRPGNFDVPSTVRNNIATVGEDGDFIYGSGYFPLLPGETERFSIAFSFGEDYNAVIKTKRIAQTIYNANYSFPKPPAMPALTATPGDGKVILYWDKAAEYSIDPVTRINDFEGYMLFKSTDPYFNDIMTITDRDGNGKRLKPLVQYDLVNGIKGLFMQSQDLLELRNGVPFYLGDDTGIQNTYVDTDVKNGVTYFYALCAYDRGLTEKDIFPSENSHTISVDVNGVLTPNKNCAVVVPNAPAAGYTPPAEGTYLERIAGSSSTIPSYTVTDPSNVKNADYEVTFNDSITDGIPVAYSYNVKEKNTGAVIISNNTYFESANNDVFNGVTLHFDTRYQTADSIKINSAKSYWNNSFDRNLRFAVQQFKLSGFPSGTRETSDYAICFSDKYDKKSTDKLLGINLAARTTNFEIFNITDPQGPLKIPFAFVSTDTIINKGDRIMMANSEASHFTWTIEFAGDSTRIPSEGDTLFISIIKPISSKDVFTFSTSSATINADKAKEQMNNIKVVPNPYVVSNIFEHPLSSEKRGRGDRVVNFIHLPAGCKISIYTSRGNLVRELEHSGSFDDGSCSWDLRSEEGLEVSYGVYFYIVDDPATGGKKTGKIALVK